MKNYVIHHNNELGRNVWSVCEENDLDNWLDSFFTLELAHAYVLELGSAHSVSVRCSIRDCKDKHNLT